MANVTMLREIRRHLKRKTASDAQRIKIEPFGFPFTDDCYTLTYYKSPTLFVKIKVLTTQEWQLNQFALSISIIW